MVCIVPRLDGKQVVVMAYIGTDWVRNQVQQAIARPFVVISNNSYEDINFCDYAYYRLLSFAMFC